MAEFKAPPPDHVNVDDSVNSDHCEIPKCLTLEAVKHPLAFCNVSALPSKGLSQACLKIDNFTGFSSILAGTQLMVHDLTGAGIEPISF
jgi:hypothetical protein